jgi:uncharacterized membrane protein YozB (DUF420 family)
MDRHFPRGAEAIIRSNSRTGGPVRIFDYSDVDRLSATMGAGMDLTCLGAFLPIAAVKSAAVISLALSVVAAALFTVGWRLAVRKRFGAHRWIQTGAVILNAVLVFVWMIRAFALYLVPGLPAKLDQASYAVTTAHALVGAVGLVFGLYVVASASELLPAGLRFHEFKPFMRTAYALYMFATAVGIAVYLLVYVAHVR